LLNPEFSAVFARSSSAMFGSLGSRRPRRRLPGWLLLLAGGMLAGAAAVLLVQERYLPPRLSAGESATLQQAKDQAEGQRAQLKAELDQARQQLQVAQAERSRLGEELSASRASAERLRADLVSLVQVLPPDPRGGSVEVRAGQFSAREGALDYQVVLLREGDSRKPLAGVLQLSVAGESARGAPATLALQPIALTLDSHLVMRGSLPLPDGFKPRETTVQVLDRAAGKPLGMRVLRVR
jgi:multidrug efflux pump subunit AcrA (membrane-fusion protein)